MKAGNLDAAISSPPFGRQNEGGGLSKLMRGEETDYKDTTGTQRQNEKSLPGYMGQGMTLGNLAGMDAAVSSPPYETEQVHNRQPEHFPQKSAYYGTNEHNLGNSENFWTAARAIVDQVHSLLKPGGHSVWVLKAFVKDKKIVDFPGQWQAMCEAAGFQTVHIHRAWLVEEKGTQLDFGGNGHTKRIERKSFFRRLAEKKGSPRIDYEIVLCMIKP